MDIPARPGRTMVHFAALRDRWRTRVGGRWYEMGNAMDSGRLVMIVLAAVVGLGGLILSSQAADDAFYYTGLVIFLFGVIWLFSLVGGAAERDER